MLQLHRPLHYSASAQLDALGAAPVLTQHTKEASVQAYLQAALSTVFLPLTVPLTSAASILQPTRIP